MRHAFTAPDGQWIYVQLQPVTRFPEWRLFLEEPTISPEGRSLLYCRSNGGSSLWLITLEAAK